MPRQPDSHHYTNSHRDHSARSCYTESYNCPVYVFPHDQVSYPPSSSQYHDGIRVRPMREGARRNSSPLKFDRGLRATPAIRRHGSPNRSSEHNDSTENEDDDMSRDLRDFAISRRQHPQTEKLRSHVTQSSRRSSIPTKNMNFDTAINLLGDITDQAIKFFEKLRTEFEEEICLINYTSSTVIDQIWKDKIDFNERGLTHQRPEKKNRSDDTDTIDTFGQTTDETQDPGTAAAASSLFTTPAQNPILSQTIHTLLTRLTDFNNCHMITAPELNIHLPSSAYRTHNEKTDAFRSLRRRIQAATPDLEGHLESVQSNHRYTRALVVELEGVKCALEGWKRSWESG